MKLKSMLKEQLALKKGLKTERFQALLERFGIGSVGFDAEAEKTLLFRREGARLLPARAGRYGTARLTVTAGERLPENADQALTVSDLYALFAASEDRLNEWPLILNTLENRYSAITVAGNSPYAECVTAYYKENPRIRVKRAPLPPLEDGCYRLPFDRESDELLFFADLCPRLPARYANGEEAVTLFVKLLYRDETDSMSYMTDLYERIIPELENRGVSVLGVFMPDESLLPDKIKLKVSTKAWSLLRKLSTPRFNALRNKKRHTEYLAENQKQLTNDVTRGYSVLYGNGPYINFDNGFRRTVGNRADVTRSIAVFGPCFVRSLGTEDKNTIPSLIQQRISGFNLTNRGSEFGTCNLIMRGEALRSGDVAVIFFQQLEKDPRPAALKHTLDLTPAFTGIKQLYKHVYDAVGHYDLTVQKAVADAVAEALEKLTGGTDASGAETGKPVFFGPETHRIPPLSVFPKAPLLGEWVAALEKQYPYSGQQRTALMMNCNPFSLGHRYLVETAAGESGEVFLFVVQEDRSFFPFEDRFRMVREGVKDLKNVHVLPSGQYLASSQTLPGYFRREDLSSTIMDAGTDIEFFLQVADALHITRRYVGTEPRDVFTNGYNRQMSEALPKSGVELIIVERKQTEDGNVVSATTVRAAINAGDAEAVRRLVPQTTFDILKEKGYLDRK